MKRLAVIAAAIAFAALPVPPSEATQYSKLSVITAAKSLGRWEALKAYIQSSGHYDEWLVSQYLTDEHPAVPAFTNALVRSGTLTDRELRTILAQSVDTSVPDAVLIGKYRRDVATESGRAFWHGRRISWREDTNTLTTVSTYADGTTFADPFTVRRPQSAEARLAQIARQRQEAEARRLAQLPLGLQEVERQRADAAARTNEVNVIYTPAP